MDNFREWLLKGIEAMFDDGWKLSPSDSRFASLSVTIRARRSNQYEDNHGDAAPGLIAWRLIELHRWRIAKCAWEKCDKAGRLFVTHKKSAYCCSTHSQNARTAKYRAKLAREGR